MLSKNIPSILKALEKIATTCKKTDFKDNKDSKKKKKKNTEESDTLTDIKEELAEANAFLKTTDEETCLFAVVFAVNIGGQEASLETISQYLGCTTYQAVAYFPMLNALTNKRLLQRNADYENLQTISNQYQVSGFVFEAIATGKDLQQYPQLQTVYQLIERLYEMITSREKGNQSTQDLVKDIMAILREATALNMVQKMLEGFSEDEIILLIYLAYGFVNDTMESDVERFIFYVYDSMERKVKVKKELMSGTHRLVEEDWVVFSEDGYFAGKEMTLSDKAVDYFFAEDLDNLEKYKAFQPKHFTVLLPDKVKTAPLYFNEQENKDISLIGNILVEENYQRAIQNLKSKGVSAGITALFYGFPGTGKTQVAYNFAAQTQRVLLMVDMSTVRDKYVGESEKQVKQIFRNYKRAKNYYDKCPILFLNEADALISKRFEIDSSADQMNNTMQNILLQEMEDFEGILLATSNLTINLDKAFERRFLYKVRFDKPDAKTRQLIWEAKMPELENQQRQILAEAYELSGGQINNVSRKYMLMNLMNDQQTPNLQVIQQLCEAEYLEQQGKQVGFKR
jgi:hypothetical protein